MSRWGIRSLQVLDVLTQFGPMTKVAIAKELGLESSQLGGTITNLMKRCVRPKRPRQIHIASWTDEHDGERCYPRAVYAIGNKPDAEQPAVDPSVRRKVARAKRIQLERAVSVFSLAAPPKVLAARRKALVNESAIKE